MPVFNSRGERQPDMITIVFLPGFAIAHEGKHLEHGPHRLPAEIAFELVHTRRAEIYDPERHDARLQALQDAAPSRDPEPENRDDVPLRQRGGRRDGR